MKPDLLANKWAESIGQALHYGLMTGRKPKVVLILDNPKTQKVYFKRVKELSKKYKFDVEYVTDEILSLDKDGKCSKDVQIKLCGIKMVALCTKFKRL